MSLFNVNFMNDSKMFVIPNFDGQDKNIGCRFDDLKNWNKYQPVQLVRLRLQLEKLLLWINYVPILGIYYFTNIIQFLASTLVKCTGRQIEI